MPDRPKAPVPEVKRELRHDQEAARIVNSMKEPDRVWTSDMVLISRALAEAESRGAEAGRGGRDWRIDLLCHTGDDGTLSIEWIESQPGPRHSVFVEPDGSMYWVSVGHDYSEHGEVRGPTEAGRGGDTRLRSAISELLAMVSWSEYGTPVRSQVREVRKLLDAPVEAGRGGEGWVSVEERMPELWKTKARKAGKRNG